MKTKNEKTINQQLRSLRNEKKIRDAQIAEFIAREHRCLDAVQNATFKLQNQVFMLEHKLEQAISELRNSNAYAINQSTEAKNRLKTPFYYLKITSQKIKQNIEMNKSLFKNAVLKHIIKF